MPLKDYLNTDERDEMIFLALTLDVMDRIITGWDKRDNLTKTERKNLKTSYAFGAKVLQSICGRLNSKAHEAFEKAALNSKVVLDMPSIVDIYQKEKKATCQAAFDESKEYFDLVGLAMHYNCNGCTKKCTSCQLYEHFEEQMLPEFSLEKDRLPNCKYAYKREI